MGGSGVIEARPARSRGRVPLGLVGMVAIVALIEARVGRSEPDLIGLAPAGWKGAGAASREQATRADVLCLGDSLVRTGLVPAILEDRLGLATFNLAVLGGSPATTYYLLKRALDAGARPRVIVIDAEPSLLMRSEPINVHREWAGLLTIPELIDLCRAESDPSLAALLLIESAVPTVRLRHDLRARLVGLIGGGPTPSGPRPSAVDARQRRINGGAYLLAADPTGRREPVDPTLAAIYYPVLWWARPTNQVFLKRLLALAESRGVAVFFLIPPCEPAMRAERERRGLDAPYLRQVGDIHDSHANVVVIDGRHAGYRADVFRDPLHLDRDGASALSQGVAAVIARWFARDLGPDRWVSLPPFERSASSASVRIEDEDQSRLALARGGGPVR